MEPQTRAEFLRRSAKLAGAATLGGGALLQAACGGGGNGSSTATSTSAAKKNVTGTINVWMHEHAPFRKVYDRIVSDFTAQHPGAQIKTLEIPYAQFENKALIAFTGGSPPDVIKLGGWDIANYATKNLIAPVDHGALGYGSLDALKAAYAPGSLNSVSHKGTTYGLPIDYNSIFLFYRKDHLSDAGYDAPPTTWEQVVEYALKLTKRDSKGNLKRAGWTYWYNLPIWDFLNFLALPVGAGGGLLNEQNQGILNQPPGIKALTWFGDLSNKHKVSSPKFTNPNFNYGQIADGTASMTVSGNFAISSIEALSKPKITLGKEFDVAPMPQWQDAAKKVTSGYSWAWLVSRRSSNPDLAWAFLRFLQSPENVSAILKGANLIVPTKDWQKGPVAVDSKGAQIVASEIPYTDYGPTLPQWSQMAQQLSNNLTALALGKKQPQQAANDFDNAMERFA